MFNPVSVWWLTCGPRSELWCKRHCSRWEWLAHLFIPLWSCGLFSVKPLAQTSGSWRSVESFTAFGLGALLPHLITFGKETAHISSPGGRQRASAVRRTWRLSPLTFVTFLSGISFIALLVGFQCFHSFVFSVGNEPTVPRQGWPALNVKGRKLDQCASWGNYFWIPARLLKPLEAAETERNTPMVNNWGGGGRTADPWTPPLQCKHTYIPS